MRILHSTGMLFPTKYGGFEKWLMELGKQAKERGDTLYVAYKQSAGGVDILDRKAEEHGVIFTVIKNDSDFFAFCQSECIDVVHFHFDFQEHGTLYRELCKKGVRIYATLHCECGYAVDRSWKKNPKLMMRIWGHRVKNCLRGKYFEKLFAVSHTIRDQYKGFYFWPDKLIVCQYLGIQRQNAETEKIKNQIPVISCIAFHSPIKGVDVLLDALKILKDKGLQFRCLQIGGGSSELNGEDTQILIERAQSLGLTDPVEWVGLTNNVHQYLNVSDIYCQPSRTEALSFAIAEAMQNGLPIVATAVGGIPELVKNGDNGFLVPVDDAAAMAEKLEVLLDNAETREKMGAESTRILEELNFYQDQSVDEIYRHYMMNSLRKH